MFSCPSFWVIKASLVCKGFSWALFSKLGYNYCFLGCSLVIFCINNLNRPSLISVKSTCTALVCCCQRAVIPTAWTSFTQRLSSCFSFYAPYHHFHLPCRKGV